MAEHIYEGQPDARQAEDIKPSRFRPRYRRLSEDELATHDLLKAAYAKVEELVSELPDGRYRSLALTALEESCMWAVKELTG